MARARVSTETVSRCATGLPALLQHATNEEKRVLARAFVTDVTLDPERRDADIGLRAPLLSPTYGGGGRSRTGE